MQTELCAAYVRRWGRHDFLLESCAIGMSTGNIPFDDKSRRWRLLKCRVIVQRLRERRYGNGPGLTVGEAGERPANATDLDSHCISSCTARWRGTITWVAPTLAIMPKCSAN